MHKYCFINKACCCNIRCRVPLPSDPFVFPWGYQTGNLHAYPVLQCTISTTPALMAEFSWAFCTRHSSMAPTAYRIPSASSATYWTNILHVISTLIITCPCTAPCLTIFTLVCAVLWFFPSTSTRISALLLAILPVAVSTTPVFIQWWTTKKRFRTFFTRYSCMTTAANCFLSAFSASYRTQFFHDIFVLFLRTSPETTPFFTVSALVFNFTGGQNNTFCFVFTFLITIIAGALTIFTSWVSRTIHISAGIYGSAPSIRLF